ncbi:MAG: tetratricopeptide repeat protein, partial [Vicinamibacterales bacterium]
ALDDLEGAAAAYRRALERASLPDAANGLGVVLVQQRQYASAVPWLEQAARDPQFIEAQLNLGIALQEAGDATRARQQYVKVIAAGSKHARERDAARTLLAQLGSR